MLPDNCMGVGRKTIPYSHMRIQNDVGMEDCVVADSNVFADNNVRPDVS